MKYKTFALEYAQKGLNTCIAFDWDPFFDVNLKEEIKYAMKNSLPIKFCDIDRAKKAGNTQSAVFNNFVSPHKPSVSAPYDSGMRDYIVSRIENGDDIVCGIFDNIDSAGHMFGFGRSTQYIGTVINCDMYAYSVLQYVREREKNLNEEWLVIFGNDHGASAEGTEIKLWKSAQHGLQPIFRLIKNIIQTAMMGLPLNKEHRDAY